MAVLKKRRVQAYGEANPFHLAQAIAKARDACAQKEGKHSPVGMRYLWICVCREGKGSDRSEASLTGEEWLCVIDESASLGADNLIISIDAALARHPEVWDMCRWAQSGHGMDVGIHFRRMSLDSSDLQQLATLDKAKTRVFFEGDACAPMEKVHEMGLAVLLPDDSGGDSHAGCPGCSLPEIMTCVGANGDIYTCGMVLGDENFRLGHVFHQKLEAIMSDKSLPHTIPHDFVEPEHECLGCPPLIDRHARIG